MKTLLIPLKIKDTESVNWSKALAAYLKRSYGSSAWSQFFDTKLAEDLDHLRDNANGTLAPEALLEQNFLYYAFLEQLHLRLGNNSTQLKLEFTWYDASYTSQSASQKYTQRTVAFEKSSVLYNVGALMTQVAKDKLESDIKASIAYMSKAFGVFQYLSENFLNSPSVDLQAENTSLLADICHAEAQELFLLKVINGSDVTKHASLIAKLSLMASSIYQKILDMFNGDADTDTPETSYGEPKWKSIISCKCFVYKSISAYNNGLALEQAGRFGEAIGFLQLANDFIISAMAQKLYVKDSIDLESIKSLITDKQKTLIKDNDFIYHDSVPPSISMESVKSMDAVKIQTLPQQLEAYMEKVTEPADALFKGIIPMEVYEKESIYSEQKAALLRKELDVADTADWEYSSFIEFTTLPKLLRDLRDTYTMNGRKSSNGNPQLSIMRDQVRSWSNSVRSSPYNDVESQMKLIIEKRKRVLELLALSPSENKENAVKLKSSLVAASKSDEKLFSFVEPYRHEINLLKSSDALMRKWDQLSSLQSQEPSLLDIDDTKNEEILSKIGHISEQHEKLKVLKDERLRIVQDLKRDVNEDDITNLIIMKRGASEASLKQLFEKELEKFKPLSTRIEATIFKQNSIINAIKISLDELFKLTGVNEDASESDPNSLERNDLYKKLNQAFTSFSVFANDLPKGLNFYDALLKMTSDLASSSSAKRSGDELKIIPPPRQMETDFRQLNLSESSNEGQFRAPTGAGLPPVPPRTYSGDSAIGLNPEHAVPPIPPKRQAYGLAGLMSGGAQSDNQALEQNPTSFYNNPSVFDESLYSRYSG
ncbi:LAQU0S16e02784g1_1 [Lachancea quebecensis]|uniref:BRO domain-containing protein 1 n=1 Tax=Lachancea quebecensis TaxID=1654605 RepID=A0A0P1KW39_9SACH|nr:LAQU0S16e02784g1_1 [Lachancea quebecensis]